MKDLKAFMEDLTKDNKLAKKFENVVEPQKVAEMAKKEGYEFTAQEYEDLAMAAVNGGFGWSDFKNGWNRFVNTAGTAVQEVANVVNAGEQAFNTAKDKWNSN